MTLSSEVERIASEGPMEPAEMLRALAALGRPLDDTRTARELSAVRERTHSADAAIEAVRKTIRT